MNIYIITLAVGKVFYLKIYFVSSIKKMDIKCVQYVVIVCVRCVMLFFYLDIFFSFGKHLSFFYEFTKVYKQLWKVFNLAVYSLFFV